MANDAPELADALTAARAAYPALAPHLDNSVVQYGTASGPNDDRQLEYYPPWEAQNPNPGKHTIEIYNRKLRGDDLRDSVAADLLHGVGSIDPRTGQPVDPQWYELKQQLGASRNARHSAMDLGAYEQEKASPYGAGPYADWDKNNRLDAYVRGALFPTQNPEWQNGIFTPEMQPIIGKMKSYLGTPAGIPNAQ